MKPLPFIPRLMAVAITLGATGVMAQSEHAATGLSQPRASAIDQTIPPPRDVPYPGTIKLAVDATDVARGIFRITETIPVAPGPLVLLHPAWLPGAHAPDGEIEKVAGLTITAGGQPIAWRRDPVDVHAFHLVVPEGVASIDVAFQFLSATDARQGPVVVTPNILALEWISTVLYPAGHFVRQILVDPTATFPAGWTAASALPTNDDKSKGGTIHYLPVALDTLADSPVFAGRHVRIEPLSPDVTLNIFADRADQLKATEPQIAVHRAMVAQAVKLFGAQHYSHYDFLYALSDRLTGIGGLEHHRSSEDQSSPDTFIDWDDNVADRDLLAHEYTHSWNGKFRRPADLWTPDYRTPMRNSLLWVYEGQTQFWGNVLAARSGMVPMPEALDALADKVAFYDTQPGRAWRPLVDTTNEEIISSRRPVPYQSWQRGEDYYNEGQLIWLDADSLIRERSKGRRSLDDFAHAFFGMHDRDWGELTYTFDDVVAALNAVEPYDWAGFFHARVDAVAPRAPLDGIRRSGYRLIFTDQPGKYWSAREKGREVIDLSYSIGLVVGKDSVVEYVQWGSPAFNAGITVGSTLVATNGDKYDDENLKRVVTAAKGGTAPVALLILQGDHYRTVDVAWTGGLRYPHLERVGKGPSSLEALYAARR